MGNGCVESGRPMRGLGYGQAKAVVSWSRDGLANVARFMKFRKRQI